MGGYRGRRIRHLKEFEGELQVVGVHGLDGVLGPARGLQRVAAVGLRVAGLVTVTADHADLQGGGHLVQGCRVG